MPGLLSDVDPEGLLEFSVVYSDRSLNHMSKSFRGVMNDISDTLKRIYHAHNVAIVPGGGTFAMEAVARQFATGKDCLVIRNGWFSYRWSQILDVGSIPSSTTVLKARPVSDEQNAPFIPPPIEEVVATIETREPAVVFAPHVETSAGMVLPDDYLEAVAAATHRVGGLFVLDCIASGALWIDMQKIGVDVLISAPQKGWSGSPGAGLVMLSELAVQRLGETTSTSFSCDLKKWLQVMHAYEGGGHTYHTTMPTDALIRFRDVMKELESCGLEQVDQSQRELGSQVRASLESSGFSSVAAEGFQAPTVVVCYTDDPEIKNGAKFAKTGIQIAGGVPLACDEPENFMTFRIGLFGIDKLQNVDRTVKSFVDALNNLPTKRVSAGP